MCQCILAWLWLCSSCAGATDPVCRVIFGRCLELVSVSVLVSRAIRASALHMVNWYRFPGWSRFGVSAVTVNSQLMGVFCLSVVCLKPCVDRLVSELIVLFVKADRGLGEPINDQGHRGGCCCWARCSLVAAGRLFRVIWQSSGGSLIDIT